MSKIGIDVSQVIYGTGVSVYTRNLVEGLVELNKRDNFVLFGGSLRKFSELRREVDYYHTTVCGNSRTKILPLPPVVLDIVWNRLHVLPVERLIGEVDVFHSSDWTQPPTKAFKVTTIHDLAPLRFPAETPKKIVDVHKRRLVWVKKEVDKVIAVSEFVKREIMELLSIEEDRIVVVPEAADLEMKQRGQGEIGEVMGRYGIEDKYLLVVGTDKRKNVGRVVEAYKKLKVQSAKLKVGLVVVGTECKEVLDGSGIVGVGYVSREDLAALYSGAEALVYPSLYEGFGLPILEAMQSGCPVVTSNIGAMAETAGDAAVLVNPRSVEEIKGGVEEVMGNRSKWVEKGKKRAKEFSWDKVARETMKVYKEAL